MNIITGVVVGAQPDARFHDPVPVGLWCAFRDPDAQVPFPLCQYPVPVGPGRVLLVQYRVGEEHGAEELDVPVEMGPMGVLLMLREEEVWSGLVVVAMVGLRWRVVVLERMVWFL